MPPYRDFTRLCSAAARLLPSPPAGSTLKVRGLPAKKNPKMEELYGRCAMSAGGAFSVDPGYPNRMNTALDLVKVLAVTIDVDLKDFPALSVALDLEPQAVKDSLYTSSQGEVEALIEATGFTDAAVRGAASAGFPPEPNRVLFTGHGCCLLYWLDEQSGWRDPAMGSGLSHERIKNAIKALHDRSPPGSLWWWDKDAKDVGTRIFPLPGEFHRECGDPRHEPFGKWVELRRSHDRVETGWLEALEARFPPVLALPTPRRPKSGPRPPAAPRGDLATSSWGYSRWLPSFAPLAFEIGGRGPCPKCDTRDALRKLEPLRYVCFHCRTRFSETDPDAEAELLEPDPVFKMDGGTVELELDARGYAVFPSESPEVVVIKTGTGTGKTHYMAQRASRWLERNGPPGQEPHSFDRWRVIGLAPTKNLATQASARWGIPYAGANDSRRFHDGSATTCFAAISGFVAEATPEDLSKTLVIIDELEPQCAQTLQMLEGQRAADAHAALCYVLAHAGAVIIGDAHAADPTVKVLEQANVYRAIKSKPPRGFTVWSTPKRRYPIRYVSPRDRINRVGKEERERSSHMQHLDLIRHELSLGLRLAIFCASKWMALGLHQALSEIFADRSGRCVVGGLGYEEEQDLSQASLTADWLIYTNAMSTGVSYDVDGHYHGTHVILENGEWFVTGPMIEQAIHRVRKPITSEITISGVWSDMRENYWMADPEQILDRASRKHTKSRELAKRFMQIRSNASKAGRFKIEQVGLLQAEAMASGVRSGLQAVLAWLEVRHDFAYYDLTDDVDEGMNATVKANVTALKLLESTETEARAALKPWELRQVMTRGHRDKAERQAAEKTLAINKYGEAYTDLDKPERVIVTHRHQFSQLPEHVDVAARVKAMLRDPQLGLEQTVKSDELRNRDFSAVASRRIAGKVGAVWRVLVEVFASADEGAREWPISTLLADRAVARVKRGLAGQELGWLHFSEDPVRSVKKILEYSGIKLANTRTGVQQQRSHRLMRSALDDIFELSEEEYRRVVSLKYQEDDSFF